jgi:hypothetical protein
MSGSQVGQDHLFRCKTDAFTDRPPLMVCVVAAAVFPAADVPDAEDFPPPRNSSQAFGALLRHGAGWQRGNTLDATVRQLH